MKLSKKAACEIVKNNPAMFYEPMPEEFKKLFPVMTVQTLEKMGWHFTVNHTGKMIGMTSLSTTCKCNAACQKRIVKSYTDLEIDYTDKKAARAALKQYIKDNPLSTDIAICGFCFSDSQQDMQETMQQPLAKNYDLLNGGIIHDDWIPVLNCLWFRGESFGDYASKYAVINMYNLAKKNRGVNFTTWTKNLVFFGQAAADGYTKPDNFKLVFSSMFINKPSKVPAKYTALVDAVFTVYTEEFAALHNITINCGARACLACLRCYANYKPGVVKHVNELLK